MTIWNCLNLKSIPQEDVLNKLRQASRHIDSLTYNRIRKYGFDNLTEFQKEIVCEVVCRQADFEYENQDLISSVLSSYSINGVSMSIGSSWNIHIERWSCNSKEICTRFIRANRFMLQIGRCIT